MRLFTPETTFYTDYADRGKFLLTWRLNVLFVIIFAILTVGFLYINPVASAFYAAVLICALGGIIYLYRTKKYVTIFWIFTISATVINTVSLLMVTGFVHYAEFFWIVSIVIFAFIGLGRKMGMVFLGIHAVAVIIHLYFFLNKNIEHHTAHSIAELTGTLVELMMALFCVGYLMHQYLKFQSYAEKQLQKANIGLKKKNEENLILAKEIHHRVKNNLQIVISLLRMHRDEVKSEDTKKHFSEAINRIMTMSLIHEKLYQEKELSIIKIEDYTRDLARAITTSGEGRREAIELNIVTEIATVGLKSIVPLGLLLNELLTNSIKYAFKKGEQGMINVHIKPCGENRICMEYSDSGIWIEQTGEDTGFGLELINVLVNQLDGEFTRTGSTYKFELGNLDH